jgi:hypothetical protein
MGSADRLDLSRLIVSSRAPADQSTAVIGGREVVTGGWAAYEASRRKARWEARGGDEMASSYPGRAVVTTQDALESLVTARAARPSGGVLGGGRDPLEVSASSAAEALRRRQRGWADPASSYLEQSAARVMSLAAPDPQELEAAPGETDPAALYRTALALHELALHELATNGAGGRPPPPPPAPPQMPCLPQQEVALRRGREAISADLVALERAALPCAEALEKYRGEIAASIAESAAALA